MGENKGKKMFLEFLDVKYPKKELSIRERIKWTSLVLICFFALSFIYPVNVSPKDFPPQLRHIMMIFGSEIGTIISLGVGPIITTILLLQILFRFGNLDLTKKENRELFYLAQKILIVFVALFEATFFVYGFRLGSTLLGDQWSLFEPKVLFIVLQIAMGSVILMYLDDIVVKWGLGSGIGLFIAAGVSKSIIVYSLNPFKGYYGEVLGVIPKFLDTANWLLLFPLIVTLLLFVVLYFIFSTKNKVLTFTTEKAIKRKFSLKFFYVSALPVIFVDAVLINTISILTVFAGVDIYNPPVEMSAIQQIAYKIASTLSLGSLYGILTPERISILDPSELFHLIIYSILFVILCTIFGMLLPWLYGINKKSVIENLRYLNIKDETIKKELSYYIPHIILVSSFLVGVLVVFSDLLGTIESGVGVLITAGVFHRFYEEFKGQKKFCPKCDSDDVEWLLPSLWSLWECRRCGYRGLIVFEK